MLLLHSTYEQTSKVANSCAFIQCFIRKTHKHSLSFDLYILQLRKSTCIYLSRILMIEQFTIHYLYLIVTENFALSLQQPGFSPIAAVRFLWVPVKPLKIRNSYGVQAFNPRIRAPPPSTLKTVTLDFNFSFCFFRESEGNHVKNSICAF